MAEAETEADASTAERAATWPGSALRRDLAVEAAAAAGNSSTKTNKNIPRTECENPIFRR